MFVVALNYFRLKNPVYFVYFVQLLTGYGILQVYGISLVTKLVDAPNPWVITGYGVSEVWFRTDSTVDNKCL